MNFYTFLPKLLNMSVTASIAIVCVLVLRLLLKKAPKVISYVLWAVVLFRLLCPVSIASGFSLFGLMNAPMEQTAAGASIIQYVPEDMIHTEVPGILLPIPGASETIENTLTQDEEQLASDSIETYVIIGTSIWFTGIFVMATYSVVSCLRLRRRLVIVSPLRDNIYLADEITTPFVMGVLKPKIYLPSDMDEHQQSYIIFHEQHHIRRGDHIIKALACIALIIHWFNPLVWVAFICSNKDMEMSCDEAVVKKMGGGILADYTASLLSLATGKTIIAGGPLAFGEGDTKGRIKNLAHWKSPALWIVLMSVIACVALGIGLLTNPENEDMSDYSEDGYYLLIGDEGVMYIEVSMKNSSGGVINADGSAFRAGEKVWLEQLQGVTDLRGVTITAFGAEGEILYEISVPENASGKAVSDIVGSDPWLLVPTSFEAADDDIIDESQPTTVKWTFSPMMSAAWHAAFQFHIELNDYSHIETSCDNGMLWNPCAKEQPREKNMRFEQGEPLCWAPVEGETLTDTVQNACVTFTVYDGEEIVDRGTLDIVQTGTENGQSFYEAQLKGASILTLWQEEGSLQASIVMAENNIYPFLDNQN